MALIKKHHYWPKYIPSNNIVGHFTGKGIGESDALQGMLDDVKFLVVAMKEPDYVMMITTTYGTLAPVGDEKMIQFPPEMDENWVRYGLAKLGQISKLPNWQKIVVLCVHNTTSALNS